jgi:hypothetical protein
LLSGDWKAYLLADIRPGIGVEMPDKHIIGLDGSAACVAWAILTERRELCRVGHVPIASKSCEAAKYIAKRIGLQCRGIPWDSITWAIETNDFPKKIKTKAGVHSFRVCRWMEGRVLQALGIGDPIEVQADNRQKLNRRRTIEAKYADELQKHKLWYTSASKVQRQCLRERNHLSRLTEDEIDALAVADAAVTKVFVEALA